MAISSKKDGSKPEEVSAFPQLGAVGFDQLALISSSASPASAILSSKSAPKSKDEPEITKSKTGLADQFSDPSKGKENDTAYLYLAMSMWAIQNADENGNVDGNGIIDVVETLKNHFGIDTSPIEKMIEKATGKTYSEFKTTASDTTFDVSGFYSQDRSGVRTPAVGNRGFDLTKALRVAATDDAGRGQCAKGVANIAEKLGWDVQRGHARDWEKTLPQHGWVKLRGITNPDDAPDGTISVYDSDLEKGRSARNNGGGVYGHVGFNYTSANGQTRELSFADLSHRGGSVRNNYNSTWIYLGDGALASNFEIAQKYNGPSVYAHAPSLRMDT